MQFITFIWVDFFYEKANTCILHKPIHDKR